MFLSKESLPPLKNNKNRLIGIDYGERRIGISLCDLTWTIASPFKIFSYKEFFENLPKLIVAENIISAVIGWPINMDGSKSNQCLRIENFVENVQKNISLPFYSWDERLSTMAVHRTMIEADLSRKRQKEVVDKMAAAYMLQGFIDSLK